MSLPATDPFTGAGALSASWTNALNSLARVSNVAQPNVDSVDCIAFWNADVFNADQKSSIVISATSLTSGSDYIGVVVRSAGTGASQKCYVLFTDGSSGAGHTEIDYYDGTTFHTIQAIATTFAIGDTVELRVAGTTLSAWKNGTQVGTNSTDTNLSSGAAGIYGNSVFASNIVGADTWTGDNNGGGMTLGPMFGG